MSGDIYTRPDDTETQYHSKVGLRGPAHRRDSMTFSKAWRIITWGVVVGVVVAWLLLR